MGRGCAGRPDGLARVRAPDRGPGTRQVSRRNRGKAVGSAAPGVGESDGLVEDAQEGAGPVPGVVERRDGGDVVAEPAANRVHQEVDRAGFPLPAGRGPKPLRAMRGVMFRERSAPAAGHADDCPPSSIADGRDAAHEGFEPLAVGVFAAEMPMERGRPVTLHCRNS